MTPTGLRVGSDVAIARYAFRNDAGSAFAHHGSTLLTMTPYALYKIGHRKRPVSS